MMDVTPYRLPQVVDREHLMEWRNALPRKSVGGVPPEVEQFIGALAAKLGDFAQYQQETSRISGKDLLLCGMKQWNGAEVVPWCYYSITVPRMQAVDHYAAMHRIYARKGRHGLINYCRARVAGTELHRLLDILNVYVFNLHSEKFKAAMEEIAAAKKIESVL